MKKTFLLALAAVLMLCGLSVSVCADEAVWVPENGGTVILPIIPGEIIKPTVKGDLNVDGVVDQKDVDLFAKYFAGWKIPAGDIRLSAGDVNGDGDVTRADAMELARKVAGWTYRDSAIYIKKTEESHIVQGTYEYEGTTQLVEYADNQLFLVVKENTDKEDVEELIKRYNGRIVGQISGPGYYQIEFPKSYDIDKLQKMESEFTANEKIEKAFVNLILHQYFDASVDEFSYASTWFPDDSFGVEESNALEKYYTIWRSWDSYNKTWGLRAANVPQAWYLASKYGTPVLDTKIAVIDNTFDASHEDLDILVGIEDEGTSEKVNHGTHVAGIIGAKTNNGTGTAGIARLSNLIGFPVGKKAETSEWIAYLAAAIECECNVINVSIGSDEYNSGTKLAVSYWAGHLADILDYYIDGAYDFLITTSAGNIGDKSHDVNYNNAITKLAETRYREHILVVGNAEIVGFNSYQRYYSSNYAGNRVDVMAPGTKIYSTYNYGQYGYLTGTSMASPFVAGVAALIKESVNSLSMPTIREIILSTANIDVNDSTANMLNAEEAMREALRRKNNTYYIKGSDQREVQVCFVDKNNNGTLKTDNIYLDIYGYAGPNDFAESGTYGEELKLTHVVSLNGNDNYSKIDTLYLHDGVYEVVFYTEYNNSDTIYLNITADTKTIWIDLTSPTPPVVEETHTLRVKFVDSETKEKLLLTDIFPPDEHNIADGDIYNSSYISLKNDEIADNDYGGIAGGFLNDEEFIIENNELVFHNLVDHDRYYLSFDAWFDGYVLPYSYDLKNNWSYGYFTVKGDTTISVPLEKEFLIVGDVTVTKENCSDILGDGSAVYDYDSQQLTLTNANITATSVIWARLTDLNIVIPEGTTSYLTANSPNSFSVIYNEGGSIYIEGDWDAERGQLYVRGCKTLIPNGEYSYYMYTDFCVNAHYINVRNTDLIFDDAWGAMRSEYDDIHIYKSNITEGIPYSIKAYLLNSAGNIDLSSVNITDSSDGGAMIFAHDDIRISSSVLSLTGTDNILITYSGEIEIKYKSVVHLMSIMSSVTEDLISAGSEIHIYDPYDSELERSVKIELPKNGIICKNSEGKSVIRCSDKSYPNEIFITPYN